MKNNDNQLRLFVYGTLKKGFWNFDRFCTRAISIEPATTWGRLYQLPAGFPALEVPERSIIATGIADPLAAGRYPNPEHHRATPKWNDPPGRRLRSGPRGTNDLRQSRLRPAAYRSVDIPWLRPYPPRQFAPSRWVLGWQ